MPLPRPRPGLWFSPAGRPESGGPRMQRQGAALTGCPWHAVKAMLREVGLRPTRQRMELGWLLFGKGDRHITAEMLYEEAGPPQGPGVVGTGYNTPHQFHLVGAPPPGALAGSEGDFVTHACHH